MNPKQVLQEDAPSADNRGAHRLTRACAGESIEPTPVPAPLDARGGEVSNLQRAARRSLFGRASRRALFWLPVLAAMILFAQVSFLGLRPAVCEMKRLSAADSVLRERHERDLALREQIYSNLVARNDPIFRERQRRLREQAGREEL